MTKYIIETGQGKKGRSFRATAVALATADGLWNPAGSTIRPVYAVFAGTDQELKFFVANLKAGKKAQSSNRSKSSDKERLEFLKTVKYNVAWQREAEGTIVTIFHPELFVLDPGMIDPDGIRVCLFVPTDWAVNAAVLEFDALLATTRAAIVDAPMVGDEAEQQGEGDVENDVKQVHEGPTAITPDSGAALDPFVTRRCAAVVESRSPLCLRGSVHRLCHLHAVTGRNHDPCETEVLLAAQADALQKQVRAGTAIDWRVLGWLGHHGHASGDGSNDDSDRDESCFPHAISPLLLRIAVAGRRQQVCCSGYFFTQWKLYLSQHTPNSSICSGRSAVRAKL